MKCPHCKEEFLMSEYNKTGRCSECGYNLKEDQNVQNIMVRKNAKTSSKYTKVDTVTSSEENHKVKSKFENKVEESSKIQKTKKTEQSKKSVVKSENSKVISSNESKKPIKKAVVTKKVHTEENETKEKKVIARKNPSVKKIDAVKPNSDEDSKSNSDNSDETPNEVFKSDTILSEQETDTVRETDEVNDDDVKDLDDEFDYAYEDDGTSDETDETESQQDNNLKEESICKPSFDDMQGAIPDNNMSDLSVSELIRQKIKEKITDKFPLLKEIHEIKARQKNRDEIKKDDMDINKSSGRKKVRNKEKITQPVMETETNFNSNYDGYYNDVVLDNEPKADRIPVKSILRVIVIIAILWFVAMFMIYYV